MSEIRARKSQNSIKRWPKYERPRELLLDKGAEHVSDAGLIAILLDTGIQGKDAVSLARDLICHFGGLRGLLHARKSDLAQIKGVGMAKAAKLLAVMEIAKRQFKEEIVGKSYIENRQDIVDYLSFSMRDLKEEFFKAVYLNKANIVISVEELFRGTVDQTSVYPREVIKRAIELGASAVIFVHNHPSGSLTPSQHDIELTRRLVEACKAVDITVHDHMLISPLGNKSLIQHKL